MPTLPAWDFATPWHHFSSWLAARADHFTRWDHFTTWLDHWQTLAAGILGIIAGSFALVAAWRTASRAEKISRQEACRDTDALRRSLAVEIRRSVRLLCQTHQVLTDFMVAFKRGGHLPHASNVAKLTSRVHPTVYPATADRIGRLGHPLAEWVVTFYANVKDIQFAGEIGATVTTRHVSPEEMDGLLSLLEGTCRNALPLLAQLPPDDDDAALRAVIEAMSTPQPAAGPQAVSVPPGGE
jgi:hypothetical protein